MAYSVKIMNTAMIRLIKRIHPKINKIVLLAFFAMCTASAVLADENIGFTIRSDGEDIPIAVSTTNVSKLRIYKNGTIYYIQLVDVGDPLATKMRINLPGGVIKAFKRFETFLNFDDLCRTDGWCPVEGWVWTKALDCAFASVNGGPEVLIGCNRSAVAFMHKKTPASALGFKPKPFCNHMVIRVNCAGGNICPASPAVPGYPGSSSEGYLDNPYWTGHIIATTNPKSSWIHNAQKLGPGYYRMGFDDNGDGSWENSYFTIDIGGAYNYTIDNLGFDCQ